MEIKKQQHTLNSSITAKNTQKQAQNFGSGASLLNAATNGLMVLDKSPMIEVAFTDTVATNIPRSVMDLKTGIPAAAETFRREFSGLFVNCLMPSFIVLGVSKLASKPIMGSEFKDVDMTKSWANGETLHKFAEIFKPVKDDEDGISKFIKNTLSQIEGLDGSDWVKYGEKLSTDELDEIAQNLIAASKATKQDKKAVKETLAQAASMIAKKTGATETLRFSGSDRQFSSNLAEILRDQVDVAKNFSKQSVKDNLDSFVKKATTLVNAKSIAGLAIVIPIATSMQYINRMITRAKYNKKGAPIYKDFGKAQTHKEMTKPEKAKFFSQKMLAAGTMVSLALLSMMKKPSLKMFQFKGMFPTLDQCRWIATSTFVSRIFASEDPNELRESTVRDVASFSGLYFLGDYAAKATASIIEKTNPEVKLTNRTFTQNADDGALKKFGNWVKNTSLKSFDEVKPADNKYKAITKIASLAFSIISLGVVLPAYNRRVTEKKVAAQKAQEAKSAQLQPQSKLLSALKNDSSFGESGVFANIAKDCYK